MRRAAVASVKFTVSMALILAVFMTAFAETNQTPGSNAVPAPKSVMLPQIESVSELLKEAKDFLESGDCEKALQAALRADALAQDSTRSTPRDRVQSQLTISSVYLAKKLPEQAEVYARQAITLWESVTDKSLDHLFDSHDLLIRSLAAQGKHAQVVALVKRVAISEKDQLAEHDIKVAPMLLSGYNSALALKDYDSAARFISLDVELHKMAIEQNKGQKEANKLRVQLAIRGQHLWGTALCLKGDYIQSITILREAAAEAQKAGLDHLRWGILVSLGTALVQGGPVPDGIATLTNVIDKLEEASTDQALALTGLVLGYTFLGEHAESERVVSKLLQVSIRAGRTDLALFSLRTQAEDLLAADRLVEARDCLENAARALANYPDQFHEDRFHTLVSLGRVYSRLSEFKNACQVLEDAWVVLPKATSNYSVVESNLTVATLCAIKSELYESMLQTDLQLTWALLAHSLTLQYAKENPLLVAESCLCLGRAYCHAREFAKVLDCLASVKQQVAKLPQANSDLKWRILDELACMYSDQGNAEDAIRARTELLDFIAQKFSRTDPRYFGELSSLAYDFFHNKSFEKATELCVETQLLFNEHEWRDLAFLPPGRSSGFTPLRVLLPHLACLAALSTTDRLAAQNAAYLCAISKGLETDVWSAQAMLSTNQSVASLRDSVEEYWSSLGENDTRAEATKAYKLRHEASGALQALLEGSKVSPRAIGNSIPANAILIDFAQYLGYDFNDKPNPLRENRYAAFLTFPPARDSTNIVVERADLGEAAPIDDAIARLLSQIKFKHIDSKIFKAALDQLSQLVYAPLAKYLTNVSHLIVCPDGQLSRVPFEMLRVGDRFLIEEKTISYVTSGREIVRLQSRSGVSPDPNLPGAATNAAGQAGRPSYVGLALVMGGPDFDLDLSKAGSSRDYRGVTFTPLPGAEAEARSVAKLLGGDCVLRIGP